MPTNSQQQFQNILDCSHHNGTIDWYKVTHNNAQKIAGVYIKCTEQERFIDHMFKNNWKKARENDLLTGAYHVIRFANYDPIKQATHFLKNCNITDKSLPPALDIETQHITTALEAGMAEEEICNAIKRFCMAICINSGKIPIIYCSYRGMSKLHSLSGLGIYYLWICDYNKNNFDNLTPRCPFPWNRGNRWTLWQYTSSGIISGFGGNVDLNYFNGNIDDLNRINK